MFWEMGATVLGLIQGVLVMFNKRSHWIFYLLQMFFLILFSVYNRLYGDVFNNSIYFVLGLIGLWMWKKGEQSNSITKARFRERIVSIVFLSLGTVLVGYILQKTDDPLPFLDAFTTISGFVATYYMMRKKIDTWVVWFVNDVFYAIEYFLLPNQAFYLFALNIIWAFMAVGSYVSWSKMMRKEKCYD